MASKKKKRGNRLKEEHKAQEKGLMKRKEMLLMKMTEGVNVRKETKQEVKKEEKKSEKQTVQKKEKDLGVTSQQELPIKKDVASDIQKSGSKNVLNLGRVFFNFSLVLIFLIILSRIFNWFDPVGFSIVALWPLILIFIGFSFFNVAGSHMRKEFVIPGMFVVFLIATGIVFQTRPVVFLTVAGMDVVEERELEAFDSVVFDGIATLVVALGERHGALIFGDEAVVDHLVTRVEENTLIIEYDNPLMRMFLFDEGKVEIHITAKMLRAVSLQGEVSAKITGIENDIFNLQVEGKSDVLLNDILVDDFIVRMTGDTNISVSGIADRSFIFVTGEGIYDGALLRSREVGMRVTGSGDITVFAQELLDVGIVGKAAVTYLGSPNITETSVIGAGTLQAGAQ